MKQDASKPPSSSPRCPITSWLCCFFKKFFSSRQCNLSNSSHENQCPDSEEQILAQGREDFMTARTLHFKVLQAKDICIPRTDIVAVPMDVDFKTLVNTFSECTFSRLPVYQETLDQIIGIIHIKDVLKYALNPKTFKLKPILRDILFISPSISLRDLLLKMQTTHIHLALVVDEFGGVDGLTTIENVIEELVGDIHDEHDTKPAPQFLKQGEGVYLADARFHLDEFEEKTGFSLTLPNREEDVDTLGGYVIALLGHMPSRGELAVSPNGIELEVIDADPRRLNRLRIRLPHKEKNLNEQ